MEKLLLFNGICSILCIGFTNSLTYTFENKDDPLFVVSDYFLSVALDTSNLSTINISHPHLTKLVKDLSPMYLRIGGTEADAFLFADETKAGSKHSSYITGDAAITGSYWLKIYEFSKNANVKLIFDLNSLLRNTDGSWNSKNAEEMIQFSEKNGIKSNWELGNEPDLYRAIYGKYVSPAQLGNDYKKLRKILNQYEIYNSSYLVGPSMFDVGSNSDTRDYLKNFLSVASDSIHAVTWHQYYFNGHQGTKEMFLNSATFNYLEQRTNVVTGIVGAANKVWLGETSSAYQGGVPGMSDRFIASFIWLDKLGLGAKLGVDVIVRQSIWVNNYSLLDIDYNPNPDWWLSIVYKKLVGTKVLSINNDGANTRPVRLYAHCAKPNNLWGNSSVVVLGLNIANSSETFNLNGFQSDSQVYQYELTTDNSLFSKSIRLNGEVLNLTKDLELPKLNPKIIASADKYTMPAYSIAFWVFSNTNVKAC